MKISVQWLKEFVDFDLTPEGLSASLRQLGFDTVSIARFGGETQNVVAAKVETVAKHPQADKLSVTQVWDGRTRWKVVCGAPNVAPGQIVALARVNAKLPHNLTIKKAVIRGQESEGMLCSARELALSEEHDGILVLPPDTPLGEDILKVLALDDVILDIEVTPNRPDVLSHWGVARELAALLRREARLPEIHIPAAGHSSALAKVEEPALCPRYLAKAFENVRVGTSPLWMKLRLERCGIRSISNAVDVTNYVLLELGHPLHVFDRDKLSGGGVSARLGRAGETLDCLDQVKRPVEGALVIADLKEPQALAGIMGGEASAVTYATKNILLESACFDPSHVRRIRTRLQVSTESSYRFERGADYFMAETASARAAHLLLKLAGASLVSQSDLRQAAPRPAEIPVSRSRLNGLLGTDFSEADIRGHLASLGFSFKGDGAAVTPPLHRRDIREEADVAEEVARLAGYDKIPAHNRPLPAPAQASPRADKILQSARERLFSAGFFEAKNDGFLSRADYQAFFGAAGPAPVEVANPISSASELLAMSLLPKLVGNLSHNLRRGHGNVRLFESATVFCLVGGKISEHVSLAFLAQGDDAPVHWKYKPRPLEIWDAKSWVESLLKQWRLAGFRFSSDALPAYLHPGESQGVWAGNKPLAVFGRVHPRLAREREIPGNTYLAEFDVSALAGEQTHEPPFQPLPKYPAVYRDFSLVFPSSADWSSISLHLIRHFEWIESVNLFDVFTGVELPEGHRSLAFQIVLRHPQRTLTDADILDMQDRIIKDLKKNFGASPRELPGGAVEAQIS